MRSRVCPSGRALVLFNEGIRDASKHWLFVALTLRAALQALRRFALFPQQDLRLPLSQSRKGAFVGSAACIAKVMRPVGVTRKT